MIMILPLSFTYTDMQYGTEDHDDSEEDAPNSDAPSNPRKEGLPGHMRSASGGVILPALPSPQLSTKARSRANSLQQSPRIPSPKGLTPMQVQGEIGRAPSPHGSITNKRHVTPPGLHDGFGESPKYIKREHRQRDISDVRNSPHQLPRPPSATTTSSIATPPMVQSQDFAVSHHAAAMVPVQQIPSFQHMAFPPPTQEQMMAMHHQQQQQQQQIIPGSPHSSTLSNAQPDYRPPALPVMHRQQLVGYHAPNYNPPSHPIRPLPMAPPLNIPAMPQHSASRSEHIANPDQNITSTSDNHASSDDPRLVSQTNHLGGPSRILLPHETGLTPVESPGNFANTLYSSSNNNGGSGGLSGIGTNITIPRISTDVGSLFYNWNTNEPGLSPATSMMLNQLQQQTPDSASASGLGGGVIAPLSAGTNVRGIAASLMSVQGSGAPPLSAGVLENFSPVTRSWLQTFSNSQAAMTSNANQTSNETQNQTSHQTQQSHQTHPSDTSEADRQVDSRTNSEMGPPPPGPSAIPLTYNAALSDRSHKTTPGTR